MRQRDTALKGDRLASISILVALAPLLGIVALLCLLFAPFKFLPAEDAAILFQYSKNLYLSGSISYNINGPHSEGATDFVLMILLSFSYWFKSNPFIVSAILSSCCLLGTSIALFRLAGTRPTVSSCLALSGVYLLLPQFSASVSGFGVLPFCFGLTLLGVAFYSDQPVQIASAALFVSLLRPDGVIFSLTLIVIAAIKSPTKKKTLFAFFLFYFVPGVIYFIWRANYFGEFLPLPFYVKSQADRFAGILVLESFVGIIPYFICCAIVFAYLKPLPRFPEPSFGLLVSFIIVPSCFYLYMNLTQNIGDRFFAYIPISLALIVARDWRLLDLKKAVAALLACLVVLLPKTCIALSNFRVFQFDNRRDMALALKRIGQGTMIVTEAGFLPYYSDWPTVDSWGLNSAEFAHRLIQPEDVKRLSPDIVMVHVDGTIEPTPQADWPRAYQKRSRKPLANPLFGDLAG